MKSFLSGGIVFVLSKVVVGDVYMHHPRGSNDRNCERNVNRNNGNRLFDSQNNNNGGYACDRGVGGPDFQPESDEVEFSSVDVTAGETTKFTQSKRMYYYSGSILPIEWTEQHGCGGNSKVSCEIVLQYACEDTLDPRVDNFWPWHTNKGEEGTEKFGTQHFRSDTNIAAPRDGIPRDENDAATDTIPDNEDAATPDTVEDRRFGMHENWDYYQLCEHTERNKGIYTADQNVKRNDQRGTRQNPNGNRRGLECPEERDYYPWWHPSPWIDIAVLSDSADKTTVCHANDFSGCTKRCQYYMENTMNFNAKGYCDANHTTQTVQDKLNSQKWNQRDWYNNKEECVGAGWAWYEVSHNDNLALNRDEGFVCAHTGFARANHLGNSYDSSVVSQTEAQTNPAYIADTKAVQGLNGNRFMWTIPEIPLTKSANYFSPDMDSAYKSCALRIRYNISSADFQQWPDDAVVAGTPTMVNASLNKDKAPLKQDPTVVIGPGDSESKGQQFVELKLNTNQYGRTFQDRSYVFSIKRRPTTNSAASNLADTPSINADEMAAKLAAGGKIYNVNVRGKRGNIVQVYPSVEYDFVPNAVALSTNDMIHFQWTGSDYNPRRGCNDATGGPPDPNIYTGPGPNGNKNARADRHNAVLTNYMAENVPLDYIGYDPADQDLAFTSKQATHKNTILASSPCYDPSTGDTNSATANECYDTISRLAFLNQQSDSASLVLRQGKECLTEDELNAINNQNERDTHPLNCAKMNAKPYPYFDGGVMFLRKSGQFPYYSSRNNNFSNRQPMATICVGSSCNIDPNTGVLQDINPETNGKPQPNTAASLSSNLQATTCYDTAAAGGANDLITISCADDNIINGETFTTPAQDNDAYGDGNEAGCQVLSTNQASSSSDEVDEVGLAVGLTVLGIFLIAAAAGLYFFYFVYNIDDGLERDPFQSYKSSKSLKKNENTASPIKPSRARPLSGQFSEVNPVSKKAPVSPPKYERVSKGKYSGKNEKDVELGKVSSKKHSGRH